MESDRPNVLASASAVWGDRADSLAEVPHADDRAASADSEGGDAD